MNLVRVEAVRNINFVVADRKGLDFIRNWIIMKASEYLKTWKRPVCM